MQISENLFRLDGCTIVWEDINKPNAGVSGSKWGVQVVVDPAGPDFQAFAAFCTQYISLTQYKAGIPDGIHKPARPVKPAEFKDMFAGFYTISAGTYKGCPQIINEQNATIDPMQFNTVIFAGQKVNLLLSLYENKEKQKGILSSLEGLQVVTSANAQRIAVYGDGTSASVDVVAAFGGVQQSAATAVQGTAAQAQTTQAPNFLI